MMLEKYSDYVMMIKGSERWQTQMALWMVQFPLGKVKVASCSVPTLLGLIFSW